MAARVVDFKKKTFKSILVLMRRMATQPKQPRRGNSSYGFTIVELLVIIVVIGILAGIVMIGYGSWQRSIATDILKNDISQAASQLKGDLNWNNAYPLSESAANMGKGLPKSQGTNYQYSRTAVNAFCLTATGTRMGIPAFMMTNEDATPKEGVCDGHEGPLVPGVDGSTWVARTAPANGWYSVAYGGGQFVAVASSGTNRVMTSPDGINWTERSGVAASEWQSVTYANGQFVAVANIGTNRVMTSPDGINWTARTSPTGSWEAVTYGNNMFVSVALSGTNRVMTSPDGINWTARTSPTGSWEAVTYGNELFVAVGRGGTSRVMTSPDGINWTARTSEGNDWYSVVYGGGQFVAVASSGTNRVMTSPDGINWTARTPAAQHNWQSVTYGNGYFVAVACATVGTGCSTGAVDTNRVMTSPDGINWTGRSVSSGIWQSVAYGKGKFVAVSRSGTVRAMTSP